MASGHDFEPVTLNWDLAGQANESLAADIFSPFQWTLSVPIRVGEYNHWTGLLDWTTGLTQTAKYTSFSAEQKLNVLIHSVDTDCSLQRLVWFLP